MKRLLLAAVTAALAAPVLAANVGVSVSVGQPGFYGRINLGDAPHPQFVYAQPVVIEPVPAGGASIAADTVRVANRSTSCSKRGTRTCMFRAIAANISGPKCFTRMISIAMSCEPA